MHTPTKKFSYINTGIAEWIVIDQNFTDISTDIDDLDNRIIFNKKRNKYQTQMVTYLLEGEGYITVLTAKGHNNYNMKLVHAFMVAADNIKENVTVHILRENRDLCEPVTIKSTEKAGKAQSFAPFKTQIINKMDKVKMYSSSRRKVIVTLVLEGVD